MSGGSKIGMSYLAAEQAADLIERKGKEIHGEVEKLKSALADVDWGGQGRAGYNAMQTEIDNAVVEFGQAVITAATVVRTTRDDLEEKDKQVARLFDI